MTVGVDPGGPGANDGTDGRRESGPAGTGERGRLRLTPRVRERLQRMADADDERCGYLLGPPAEGDLATAVVPTRNVSVSPWRFGISEADASRVADRAAATGRALRAVFHTHPDGPPVPSAVDSRRAARSTLPWVIATRDGVAVVSA